MARLKFGAFLAPHHPIGEHPTLQFRRDLDLAEHLDRLGYDEFWCGEHHSTGWEVIASPEMFLAAAGERTHTIRLGTGVVSLPYHHPFNVAQRIVQLDHMTRGRVIFGSGPGALPSDAYMLGIDPMVQRDRQDEAIGVIQRLLKGEERFSHESDWFSLKDAALQRGEADVDPYDALSPQLQRIASYALEHPQQIALETAQAEIGIPAHQRRSGVEGLLRFQPLQGLSQESFLRLVIAGRRCGASSPDYRLDFGTNIYVRSAHEGLGHGVGEGPHPLAAAGGQHHRPHWPSSSSRRASGARSAIPGDGALLTGVLPSTGRGRRARRAAGRSGRS